MSYILEIKFRMELFGLKSVIDSKDNAVFEEVIKDSEFEELMRTLEKVCEEVCKDKKLKKTFNSIIVSLKEFREVRKIEDLFSDHKFEQAVADLEKVYTSIYGKAEEYDSEYQHFFEEIKRIADSQPKERKSGSVRMWKKVALGAAIAASSAAAYYLKKRKKESVENKHKGGGS